MTIRVLTSDDVQQYRIVRLAALNEQPPAFGTPAEKEENLALENLASRLDQSEDGYFLGAFVGETLGGIIRFSLFNEVNEKHRGYIAGLYVTPSLRRNGLARGLLAEVLRRADQYPGLRRIHLTVVSGQDAAIRLYQSMGFSIYGTECEAFSSGGCYYDEHLMELPLTHA